MRLQLLHDIRVELCVLSLNALLLQSLVTGCRLVGTIRSCKIWRKRILQKILEVDMHDFLETLKTSVPSDWKRVRESLMPDLKQ